MTVKIRVICVIRVLFLCKFPEFFGRRSARYIVVRAVSLFPKKNNGVGCFQAFPESHRQSLRQKPEQPRTRRCRSVPSVKRYRHRQPEFHTPSLLMGEIQTLHITKDERGVLLQNKGREDRYPEHNRRRSHPVAVAGEVFRQGCILHRYTANLFSPNDQFICLSKSLWKKCVGFYQIIKPFIRILPPDIKHEMRWQVILLQKLF